MQALGGAKNHMIVLPDADIDMAADAAVSAGYGSAGERCMAVAVVVAVGGAGEPLVAAIKERLPKIKVGNGFEPDVEMGPLITQEHRDKVAAISTPAPSRAPRSWRTDARPRRTGLLRPVASTTCGPRWTRTGTRSSALCSPSCTSTRTTRR